MNLAARSFSSRPFASKIEVLSGGLEEGKPVKPTASAAVMERAMGIEPTSEAWEASNKNLKTLELAALSDFGMLLKWKIAGKSKDKSKY